MCLSIEGWGAVVGGSALLESHRMDISQVDGLLLSGKKSGGGELYEVSILGINWNSPRPFRKYGHLGYLDDSVVERLSAFGSGRVILGS